MCQILRTYGLYDCIENKNAVIKIDSKIKFHHARMKFEDLNQLSFISRNGQMEYFTLSMGLVKYQRHFKHQGMFLFHGCEILCILVLIDNFIILSNDRVCQYKHFQIF